MTPNAQSTIETLIHLALLIALSTILWSIGHVLAENEKKINYSLEQKASELACCQAVNSAITNQVRNLQKLPADCSIQQQKNPKTIGNCPLLSESVSQTPDHTIEINNEKA